MTYQIVRTALLVITLLFSLFFCHDQAQAGPPLICHPYEIGEAKSLPWAGSEWRDVKKDYDSNRLVEDTLALLQPDTPVIVRMETLRRATIYAVWAKHDHEVGYRVTNNNVAGQLLERLMRRVQESGRGGRIDPLALFDAGYFRESWRNAVGHANSGSVPGPDGYVMVKKAAQLRGGDAAINFAAALITSVRPDKALHRDHLQKAVAGADEGSLLARNLVRHFGRRGNNLAELRASLGLAQR